MTHRDDAHGGDAGELSVGRSPDETQVCRRRWQSSAPSTIRDLRYDLTFIDSRHRSDPIRGRAVVSLTLQAPSRVVFDFAQPRQNVLGVKIDGADAGADVVNGHIVVPARATRAGRNRIELEFVAGDEALNRNDEFLYTLFVPSRAPDVSLFRPARSEGALSVDACRSRRVAGGGQWRQPVSGWGAAERVGRNPGRVRGDAAAADVSVCVRGGEVLD